MLELVRKGDGWTLGYGGDTLNTAIHLARCGHDVTYFSALGDDPFSRDLRQRWEAEGLDCSLVLAHPTRQAGLYAITTGVGGERGFTYWRDTSAAREMFALPGSEEARRRVAGFDVLFFSLVSLAILPPEGQAEVFALAGTIKDRGGRVAFDANYRPALWEGPQQAIAARDAAIRLADIGLPTCDDESALSGMSDPARVAAHWRGLGCDEVIVKLGARGCMAPDGTVLAPPEQLSPVDTSGAGDAFNAGYLAARLDGVEPQAACKRGHALAAWTIMRRGAIPPRDADYPGLSS